MRDYEVVYIFKSSLTTEEIEGRLEAYHGKILAAEGSEITAVEHWGKRQLAYPIDRNDNGYYVVTQFTASPGVLPDFERVLKLDDDLLRHLVVLSEGELPMPAMDERGGDNDRDNGDRRRGRDEGAGGSEGDGDAAETGDDAAEVGEDSAGDADADDADADDADADEDNDDDADDEGDAEDGDADAGDDVDQTIEGIGNDVPIATIVTEIRNSLIPRVLASVIAASTSQCAPSVSRVSPAMTRAIEMTLGIHTIGSIWLTGSALFIAFFSA